METQEIFNVWAIGRNYSEHVSEMKAPRPDAPVVFLKPGSAVKRGTEFSLPNWTTEVHHELEVALQFDDHLKVFKWGLALDLTERKIQADLKSKSLPWTLSKGFPQSCPISSLLPLKNLDELQNITFELEVNHHLRQKGQPKDMIFSFSTLVSYILNHFPVRSGDLVLTGTPSGVGPLIRGDHLLARVNGQPFQEWTVL